MVDFTITNITAGSVTYNGQVITAGNSYNVTSKHTDFATNGIFLADLVQGYVAITIGSRTLSGPGPAQLLVQMTLLSFSGLLDSPIPSRAILLGGQDPSGNIIPGNINNYNEQIFQYSNLFINLTGNATTVVKSGEGRLHGVMINHNSGGGTITIYNNTAASGTKIATLDLATAGTLGVSIPSPCFIGPLGVEFSTGLTVVTAGSSSNDITILYR